MDEALHLEDVCETEHHLWCVACIRAEDQLLISSVVSGSVCSEDLSYFDEASR